MTRIISDEALAAVTIYSEAAGEPYEGKLAVAEVIFRRMQTRYSSDGTLAGTVLRRYQFSAFNDDQRDNGWLVHCMQIADNQEGVTDCIRAWSEATLGSNTVPGAVLYVNLVVVAAPAWAVPEKLVATVGHHSFYKG